MCVMLVLCYPGGPLKKGGEGGSWVFLLSVCDRLRAFFLST